MQIASELRISTVRNNGRISKERGEERTRSSRHHENNGKDPPSIIKAVLCGCCSYTTSTNQVERGINETRLFEPSSTRKKNMEWASLHCLCDERSTSRDLSEPAGKPKLRRMAVPGGPVPRQQRPLTLFPKPSPKQFRPRPLRWPRQMLLHPHQLLRCNLW